MKANSANLAMTFRAEFADPLFDLAGGAPAFQKCVYKEFKDKYPWALNAQGFDWDGDRFSSDALLRIKMFGGYAQMSVTKSYTSLELSQLSLGDQQVCVDCVDILMRSLGEVFEDLTFARVDVSSNLQVEVPGSAAQQLINVAGDQALCSLLTFGGTGQLPSMSASFGNRDQGWASSINISIDPWKDDMMILAYQSRHLGAQSSFESLVVSQFQVLSQLVGFVQVQVQ